MTNEELQLFVSNLNKDEATTLYNLLVNIIFGTSNNIDSETHNHTSVVCPHCGCKRVYRNGHTKEGRQKYLCTNSECKKSFSITTNTIIFNSRTSSKTWIEFIKMEFQGCSLRHESRELGVSKTTCFAWRQKLHEAISNLMDKITLAGEVELDGKYFKINLKGTKKHNMPRHSKIRGASGKATRGISKHKVCVMSGIDENDNVFLKIAGLSSEDKAKCDKIKPKLNGCTTLITDSKAALINLAREMGVMSQVIPSQKHTNNAGYNINTINKIHQELEIYLLRFHGVSTRHLQGYMDFFIFRRILNNKHEREDLKRNEMYNSSIATSPHLYFNEVCKKPMPIDLYQAYSEYNYGIYAKSTSNGV